jgi:hypothetical protein
MDRGACLKRWRESSAAGIPIIGAGAGTGISAKCAEAAGADLIIILQLPDRIPLIDRLSQEHILHTIRRQKTNPRGVLEALRLIEQIRAPTLSGPPARGKNHFPGRGSTEFGILCAWRFDSLRVTTSRLDSQAPALERHLRGKQLTQL